MPIRKEFRHFYRGPAWQAARAVTRERAGDKCQRCGAANRSIGYFLPSGSFHPVADPLRFKPPARFPEARLVLIQCGACHRNNTAGDDRPDNLLWLCRGCHLRFDAPHHRASRATRKDSRRPLLELLEELCSAAERHIFASAKARP